MRRALVRVGAPLVASALSLGCAREQSAPAPVSDGERTSYAIGLHLGMRLRDMQAALDPDAIVAGFREGAALATATASAGRPQPRLDAGEIRAELERLAEATREREAAARRALADRNAQAGAAFLADNRSRPGVVELPSGVQYRIVEAGDGEPPAVADRITVEYEGRLLDGAVFDTSEDRFAPTILRLRRTPRSWQEVLPRVGVGGRVEMWVPALPGSEPSIGLAPPGELLVFTVRVIAVDRHVNPEFARSPP